MTVTVYALNPASGDLKTVTVNYATAMFRDRATDRLFVSSYTSAVALFTAATRLSGTWKRLVVLPKYDTFKWLFVESEFVDANGAAASVTVTIKDAAEATTFATMTVSSRDPVILPVFRERELMISVSSKARVTEVTLASSSEELKAL